MAQGTGDNDERQTTTYMAPTRGVTTCSDTPCGCHASAIHDVQLITSTRHLRTYWLFRWGLPVLLCAIALGFNLYRLGDPSIWFDEAFSVELARQPLPLLWHIIFGPEPNMELYYLFLHYWLLITHALGFNPTEVVVRLPSTIFAALSTGVVFLLGRRFLNTAAAGVGASLYLLNDLQLTYAQQARGYSLQLPLLCLSWYALFAALSTPAHGHGEPVPTIWFDHLSRWWLCYILVTTLAVYTQLFSAFVLLAQVCTVGILCLLPNQWRTRVRQRLVAFCLSLLAIVMLNIPMILESQAGAKTDWLPVPHLPDLLNLFVVISGYNTPYLQAIIICSITGIALVAITSSTQLNNIIRIRDALSAQIHTCIAFVRKRANKQWAWHPQHIWQHKQTWHPQGVSLHVSPAVNGGHPRRRRMLHVVTPLVGAMHTDIMSPPAMSPPTCWLPMLIALLCWLVVPTVVSYAISHTALHLFSPRYLVVIVPPLCLLMGMAVAALRVRVVQIVIALILIVLALSAVPMYYQSAQVEDWNTATHWLIQHYQPDDGIVCYDNAVEQGCQIAVQYYLDAYPSAAHFDADSPGAFSWQRFGPENAAEGYDAAINPTSLARYAAKHPRIFFVTGRIPTNADAARALAAQHWLDIHYHFIAQITTRTVDVRLYRTH